MTRDEHIAAAEEWLAEAERLAGQDYNVAEAAGIGLLHAALAGLSPVVVTMPHPSRPAGQGHDGQETPR